MLPYFIFTEDIEGFCQLIGYSIDDNVSINKRVCTYALEGENTPRITTHHLGYEVSPLIPPEKVIVYLTLILNGYSYEEAIKEIDVVWNGHSPFA